MRAALAIAAALSCLAATCYTGARPLRFVPSPDLDSGPTFLVFDAVDGDFPVEAAKIAVGELHGDEIWRLEGRATVRSIVYGQAVEGLSETLPPRPLERGKAYYILVEGPAIWVGGHYGTYSFLVGEDGRISPAPLRFGRDQSSP